MDPGRASLSSRLVETFGFGLHGKEMRGNDVCPSSCLASEHLV